MVTTEVEQKPIRIREFALVLAVAFSSTLLASIYVLIGGKIPHDPASAGLRVLNFMVYEIIAILVLIYVLYRQNRTLEDLGFVFSRNDILLSIGLSMLAYGAYYVSYFQIYHAYTFVTGHTMPAPQHSSAIAEGLTFGSILFVMLNPFYEELIARAYVMTELGFFTNSKVIAILGSVALQTAYHLYQGFPYALSLAATFLIFSLYYATAKRVWPIVLAHFYFDLFALVAAAYR